MTTQKDFKRLVRGRMQKTGESYTSARASVLRSRASRDLSAKRKAQSVEGNGRQTDLTLAPAPSGAIDTSTADFAKIAGMSDEKLKEKTGCTWDRWVWALDQANAHNWPHTEIARYVHEKYKVPGWWSQTVTVGYERIKGLREGGQRRSGSWEASKSKTISASIAAVFKAFKQPKVRAGWLENLVVIRTSVPNKSLRLTWEDGTSVEVYLVSKGRSKTQVAVQHTRLASRDVAERMKAFWASRLEVLTGRLSPTQ